MYQHVVVAVLIWAVHSLSFGGIAHAEEMDIVPIERSFSTVEGAMAVPLLVIEAGNRDGPPILFIHGMSQSNLSWDSQFTEMLAKDHHLIAFDLRGHGGSAKPWHVSDYAGSQIWAGDVAAVIDALNLTDVTIVAWSFGGAVAASYLRHYGSRNVRALNLVGTTGGLVANPPSPPGDFSAIMESARKRASLDLRENIEGYRTMPDNLTAEPMTDADRETAFQVGLMHPSYVRRAFTTLPVDNADIAGEVDVPVLISVGTRDVGLAVDTARSLAAILPSATLSVYEGDGHFPAYESVQRFNRELAELAADPGSQGASPRSK